MNRKTTTILVTGTLFLLGVSALYIGTRLNQPDQVTPEESEAADCSGIEAEINVAGKGWSASNQTVVVGQSVCVRSAVFQGSTVIASRTSDNNTGSVCTTSTVSGAPTCNMAGGTCFTVGEWFQAGGAKTINVLALLYKNETEWTAQNGCAVQRVLTIQTAAVPTPTITPAATGTTTPIDTTPVVTQLPATGILDEKSSRLMLIGSFFIIVGIGSYVIGRRKMTV